MKLFFMLKGVTQNRELTNISCNKSGAPESRSSRLERWTLVHPSMSEVYIWLQHPRYPKASGKVVNSNSYQYPTGTSASHRPNFPDSPPRWTNAINTMIKQSETFNYSTLSLCSEVKSELNVSTLLISITNYTDVLTTYWPATSMAATKRNDDGIYLCQNNISN